MEKAITYQLKIKRESIQNKSKVKSAITQGRPELEAVKILATEGLIIVHWANTNEACYSHK